MSRKFLHTADLHLDSPLQDLLFFPERAEKFRNATRTALVRIVDLAMEEQVDFVLFAGDIYDTGLQSYDTALFFHRQMVRLKDAGIKAYVIYGNHDAVSKLDKQVPLPANVYVFPEGHAQTQVDEDLGVAIHGRSYPAREAPEGFVASYPQPRLGLVNIGLLHTSLSGAAGHQPYAPCTVEALAAKAYHYWALGHVHTRQVVSQEPWIVYPGPPQARQEREAGERTCEIVTFDDSRVLSVVPRSIEPIPWRLLDVDLSHCGTRDQALDAIDAHLHAEADALTCDAAVVTVALSGPTSAHGELVGDPTKLQNELRALAQTNAAPEIWLARVHLATTPLTSLESLENDAGPLGSVLREARSLLANFAQSGLGEVFDPLRKKLPNPELLNDQALAALLPEVQQMLADRLREVEP